jgi:hypothetical protein
MPYPPQFSSTLTYEQKYDLDEIDVFLDGDGTDPMFFSISGLPDKLAFGKHYFYISLLDSSFQDYYLRPGSRILFEFKSINGVVLKSDVLKVNQRNGVITCFVEVLEDPLYTRLDIEDGDGTLTMVGSLESRGTSTPIPDKFKGAMNYRCTFPIDIRKNLVNASSPIVIQSTHKIESTRGTFSFVKASISATRVQRQMEHNPDGSVSSIQNPTPTL